MNTPKIILSKSKCVRYYLSYLPKLHGTENLLFAYH